MFEVRGVSLTGGPSGKYAIIHDVSKTVVFETRKLTAKEGSAFTRAAQAQFASLASVWTSCKTKTRLRRWFLDHPEDFWRAWEALKCFR